MDTCVRIYEKDGILYRRAIVNDVIDDTFSVYDIIREAGEMKSVSGKRLFSYVEDVVLYRRLLEDNPNIVALDGGEIVGYCISDVSQLSLCNMISAIEASLVNPGAEGYAEGTQMVNPDWRIEGTYTDYKRLVKGDSFIFKTYSVRRKAQGRGIGYEMGKHLLKHMYSVGKRYGYVTVHPENTTSIRILSKLGFVFLWRNESLYGGQPRLIGILDMDRAKDKVETESWDD